MNEPTPTPTPEPVRSVVQTRAPLFQAPAPKKPGRSTALIGGNLRPGMVPGGFSSELSRTSNAGCDERLASRNKKQRQPTPEQIREVADRFLAARRPAVEPPPQHPPGTP